MLSLQLRQELQAVQTWIQNDLYLETISAQINTYTHSKMFLLNIFIQYVSTSDFSPCAPVWAHTAEHFHQHITVNQGWQRNAVVPNQAWKELNRWLNSLTGSSSAELIPPAPTLTYSTRASIFIMSASVSTPPFSGGYLFNLLCTRSSYFLCFIHILKWSLVK